jgi:hypothetical protein
LRVRDASGEHATYGEAVEYLCVHARTLRTKIDVGVWSEAIGIIQDPVAADEAWHDAVRRLHEAAEDAGIPGGIGLLELRGEFGERSGFPPAPVPRTTGWVCPSGRCTRVELRDHATATPACDVAGVPMRPVD